MLTQITKDDTFVQSLIDEGRITEEEAHTHPQRSLLLRAITGQDVDPSLTVREARAGDRYLLCSDGLSGVVSDETLAETLRAYRDPRECADRMIDLALRGGGPDNITCIVADVVDVDFGEDAPIVGGAAGDGRDDTPPPDSAAARASATTLTRTAPLRVQPVAPAPVARFRGLRLALGRRRRAGGAGRRRGARPHVGAAAVLRGHRAGARGDLPGGARRACWGCRCSTWWSETDIALTDLPEAERSPVQDGILVTEGGLAGAQARSALLRGGCSRRARPPGWRDRPRLWSRRRPIRSSRPPTPRRPCPPTRAGRRRRARHHPAPDGGRPSRA